MSVSMVTGSQMRLAVSRIDAMRAEGFGEDEIASLLYFATGEMVDRVALGADEYSPMDERMVQA